MRRIILSKQLRATTMIEYVALAIVAVCLLMYISRSRVNAHSLYNRLGGVYAIAAVVDRFSERVIANHKVGKNSTNPFLQAWSADATRLPGLKFMRTLWICDVAGGPYTYIPSQHGKHSRLGLDVAHCGLHISPDEFAEVASELTATLAEMKVPAREASELLAAFNAHMGEVTSCPMALDISKMPVVSKTPGASGVAIAK
jgi:hemoglobin